MEQKTVIHRQVPIHRGMPILSSNRLSMKTESIKLVQFKYIMLKHTSVISCGLLSSGIQLTMLFIVRKRN